MIHPKSIVALTPPTLHADEKKRHFASVSLLTIIEHYQSYLYDIDYLVTMKSFSLLFALLSSLVAAQNETNGDQWGGCQATFSGASVDTLEKIEIGKQTIVCFHVGNTKDWARGVDYIRLSFQPEADQYSRMHIPNCKNSPRLRRALRMTRMTLITALLFFSIQ
jgi:hypothetical protein